MKKVRLDQLVFELGLTESRERAKTTIMSGHVFVNGQRADKPGMPVAPDAKVEVHGEALPFVSRGGFKLDKALRVFPVDPAGKHCIDCGASTGGFTDVLLQHGAERVYSVDVGYGQLAWKLRNDERVNKTVNAHRQLFPFHAPASPHKTVHTLCILIFSQFHFTAESLFYQAFPPTEINFPRPHTKGQVPAGNPA